MKLNWKAILPAVWMGAAWLLCAAVNTGGAWMGDPAKPVNVAVTLLYIAVGTGAALTAGRRGKWFALISAVCGLVCWYCTLGDRVWGLLFAPLAAIPFYGLHGWLNWQQTYLLAAGISLLWLLLSGKKRGRTDGTE